MSITFKQYQAFTGTTAIYPNLGKNPEYPTLGLAGEAGEIANKVKKMQRDNLSIHDLSEFVSKEIGDVLWYCSQLASEFHLSLNDVVVENMVKLTDRKERDVIKGSGDDR